MICQTRFKVVLIGLFLGLIEGVIRAFCPGFPVVEVFSFQGAAITGYLALKTAGNTGRAKYTCANGAKNGQTNETQD